MILLVAGCIEADAPAPTPDSTPSSQTPATSSTTASPPDPTLNLTIRRRGPERVEHYAGQSKFVLEPADLVLTPGETLALVATFKNVDGRQFQYAAANGACGSEALRVGTGPFELIEMDTQPNHLKFNRACLAAYFIHGVEPDETVVRRIDWNGTFWLIDHGSAEHGLPVEARYMAVAPGNWPVRVGWYGDASYSTRQNYDLVIRETDANRATRLAPDRCRASTGSTVKMSNLTVGLERTQAMLGTPVRVWFNYTLQAASPGCYLLPEPPRILYGGEGPGSSMTAICQRRAPLYVEIGNEPVQGHWLQVWDGRAGCSGDKYVAPGRFTVAGGPSDSFEYHEGKPWAYLDWAASG